MEPVRDISSGTHFCWSDDPFEISSHGKCVWSVELKTPVVDFLDCMKVARWMFRDSECCGKGIEYLYPLIVKYFIPRVILPCEAGDPGAFAKSFVDFDGDETASLRAKPVALETCLRCLATTKGSVSKEDVQRYAEWKS